MAANLERLAVLYRKHGYVAEAEVLKAQAVVFRRGGLPEELPEEGGILSSEISDKGSTETPEWSLTLLKRDLVEVLSVRPEGEAPLAESLAERVNQKVGQRLPDDMRLDELSLDRKIFYPKDEKLGTQAATYSIDERRVYAFNETLKYLSKYGYTTVGDVRTLFALGIGGTRIDRKDNSERTKYFGMDVRKRTFIYIALKKPQQ